MKRSRLLGGNVARMRSSASGRDSCDERMHALPLVRTVGDDIDGRVLPHWPISTDGGVSPRWRHDGRELFSVITVSTVPFGATVTDGRLMAVEASGAVERFNAGIPKLLFPVSAKSSQYIPLATASVS